MLRKNSSKKVRGIPLCATVAAITALFGGADEVRALTLETDNPDVQMTWGNTVKYNAGIRMEGRDSVIGNSANNDEGDYRVDKHGLVTNRVDLLSEFDFNYQRKFGFRVSAAAWNDFAFDDEVNTNPRYASRGSYINNQFSSYTKRYAKGLSGEILDAYVFGNFDLGEMPANVKLGRHTVLWGEAIALSAHSVSYAQAPSDGNKALMTPGVDAKETALPIGQISGTLQVTPQLALSAQYYYEWKPTRLAEGGTYLGGTDFILQGPDRFSAAPGLFLVNTGVKKASDSGDFGVSARWSPDWLDGTAGMYYREFSERSPTVSLNLANRTYQAVYPEKAKLYGMSMSKNLGGVSAGAELIYRQNTALNGTISDGAIEGARGNTAHALFNAVTVLPRNSLWSQASLIGELAYSRWNTVNSGQKYFNGCSSRPVGDQGAETGCVTKDAWQAFVRFSPSWTAVAPGVDVAAFASLLVGLKGNSAVLGGGNKKAGSYGIGATLTYNQQHDFTLAYYDYLATNSAKADGTIRVSNGSQIQDRGWLSLTYKGSF